MQAGKNHSSYAATMIYAGTKVPLVPLFRKHQQAFESPTRQVMSKDEFQILYNMVTAPEFHLKNHVNSRSAAALTDCGQLDLASSVLRAALPSLGSPSRNRPLAVDAARELLAETTEVDVEVDEHETVTSDVEVEVDEKVDEKSAADAARELLAEANGCPGAPEVDDGLPED